MEPTSHDCAESSQERQPTGASTEFPIAPREPDQSTRYSKKITAKIKRVTRTLLTHAAGSKADSSRQSHFASVDDEINSTTYGPLPPDHAADLNHNIETLKSKAALCSLCKSMKSEALTQKYGPECYSHVSDIRDLDRLSTWCDVCNLLKFGLFVMVVQAARVSGSMLQHDDLNDVVTALATLRPLVDKLKGCQLRDPCPLVLKVYPGGSFGHDRLHFGTLDKRLDRVRSGGTAMDLSFGWLILHRDGPMSPPPMLPRLDEAALFD